MFAILNIAYFCYGGSFAIIRATGAATSVACPWPFPEAKVYDPQGFYAKPGSRDRTWRGSGTGGSPLSPGGPTWPPTPTAVVAHRMSAGATSRTVGRNESQGGWPR